jgi:superfamily II DNA or RNA helicase
MPFQSNLSFYFAGVDDDVPRLPLRTVSNDAAELVLVQPKKAIVLRDYQQEATDCCLRDLQEVRSSLIVLATGLGKTILFCKLTERWEGRVLVLAHLEELLQNARDDLRSITGEAIGTERGDEHHEGERIVVGLIQSVRGRLHHFKPNHFSLIIVDEAHHAASKDYRRVLEYFPDAKVVGLTATDSRADGKPLPFDRISYRMGIREGQDQSYLVPVRGKRVVISELNLSRVKRKGPEGDGDFDDKALDDEMVRGAVAIADVLTTDYIFEKGILFFPGCRSAQLCCDMINEREPDSAVYIDGKIVGDERRELINLLKDGKRRWLCNVGIATEGFNWPEASVVGMCSPTLSRPAYVQRVGRGTRPLAGLLNGLLTSSLRKAAIAGSSKPSMLILDFVGVSANLDLISAETFLDDPANDNESDDDLDTFGTIEAEKDEFDEDDLETFGTPINLNLKAIAKGIKSQTSHWYDDFDPFEASGQKLPSLTLNNSELGKEPSLSYKQYRLLCKYGINDESLTKNEAQKLVSYAAGQGFRLWAPQLLTLKKIYRDIIDNRAETFG